MGVLQDIQFVDSALMDHFAEVTAPYDDPRPENDFRVGVGTRPLTEEDDAFTMFVEPAAPEALPAVLQASRELGLDRLDGVTYEERADGFSLRADNVEILYAALRVAFSGGEPQRSMAELQAALREWLAAQDLTEVSVMFSQGRGLSAILSPSPEEDFDNPMDEDTYEQHYQGILSVLLERASSWESTSVEVLSYERQVALSAAGVNEFFSWLGSAGV